MHHEYLLRDYESRQQWRSGGWGGNRAHNHSNSFCVQLTKPITTGSLFPPLEFGSVHPTISQLSPETEILSSSICSFCLFPYAAKLRKGVSSPEVSVLTSFVYRFHRNQTKQLICVKILREFIILTSNIITKEN